MGTFKRWRAWLAGYALIGVLFGLAWWNNPSNVGGATEAQRAWLALGFGMIGTFLFVPPLVLRKDHETGQQKTLIVVLALFLAMALWWVGFLPSDPFGCSRVDAPDCHTNAATRWRAFAEISVVWVLAFLVSGVVSRILQRRYVQKLAASSP